MFACFRELGGEGAGGPLFLVRVGRLVLVLGGCWSLDVWIWSADTLALASCARGYVESAGLLGGSCECEGTLVWAS